MFPFNKFAVVALVALALGVGAAVAAGTGGSDDPAGVSVGTVAGTTEDAGTATEPGEDVKGPCDEAEHANDPQCAGAQVPEDNDDDAIGDDGPNHDANDDQGEDNDDQGENEDNSGPSANSGPGSSHSGSGGGDDSSGHDAGDDNGGNSGHGGDDD